MRTFKINSLGNFQIYNRVLLTILTRLSVTSPEVWKFVLFDHLGFFHGIICYISIKIVLIPIDLGHWFPSFPDVYLTHFWAMILTDPFALSPLGESCGGGSCCSEISLCSAHTQDVRETFKLCIPCYLVEGDYFIVWTVDRTGYIIYGPRAKWTWVSRIQND